MTHSEKIDHLIQDLRERGVSRYTAAPPFFRMMWRLGWNVRPPLFQPFLQMLLGSVLLFGTTWGTFMWIVFWRHQGLGLSGAVYTAASTSTIVGLLMAAFYRWKARKLDLPDWEAYPDE